MQPKRTIVGLAHCFNHKVSHENGQKGPPTQEKWPILAGARSHHQKLAQPPMPPPSPSKIFYLPNLYLELCHTFPVTARVSPLSVKIHKSRLAYYFTAYCFKIVL